MPLLGIVALYVFIGSAGFFPKPWPVYQTYYDMLADGFRAGHLYTTYTPNPELLRVENPWDSRNWRLWLGDASYFDGHYYLYWGPVPAILQAFAKGALGIERVVGDQYLTFGFFSLSTLAGAILIARMVPRLFGELPRYLVPLGVVTFGCANPVLHLVATGGTYQAAIVGGQAFLVTGLLFAFEAVWLGQQARRSWPHLFGAGAAWGLALGCRISLAPAIAALALLVVSATFLSGPRQPPATEVSEEPARSKDSLERSRRLRLLRSAVALGLPIVASSIALLLYNKLRFNEYLEFGTTWQTTTLKFKLSSTYWLPNIYSYLLQTYERSGEFPYIHQLVHLGPSAIPEWIGYPEGYIADEPVVGLVHAVPVSWLGPVAAVVAVRTVTVSRQGMVNRQRLYLTYCGCFIVAGTLTAIPALSICIPTMRYLADFSHGWILLGLLGGYSLCDWARRVHPRSWRRALRPVAIAALAVTSLSTIFFGVALGIQGYADHFKRFNPELFRTMLERLSF